MLSNLNNIPPFIPPVWCVNPHIQTIAGSLFSRPKPISCDTVEISTPDGDFLELNVKTGPKNRPAVVLIHGLEGSSQSRYIIELMGILSKRGYSVVAVNLRGCGTRINNKRRFYHSGETEDLRTVFSWVNEHIQHSSIGAAGFSLGGNVLIKLLGEDSSSTLIDRAIVVSSPYDLYYGSQTIQQGFNRLYERMFVRNMNKKVEDKRKAYPDLPVFTGSTLHDFDDEVTAPLNGFEDADDYYAKCSSGQFVERIETQTLLIHSKDDPICPCEMVPMNSIRQNGYVDYILTDRGGHVGFWSKPYGWLNKIIANYFGRDFA